MPLMLLRNLTPATVSGRPAAAPPLPRRGGSVNLLLPRLNRTAPIVASLPSPADAATYAARIADAEAAGDWLAAVEVLTEIRILRVDAPPAAYEAAARVCASEGDWKKAVESLVAAEAAAGEGTPAAASAVEAVFRRLARELEGGASLDLLASLSSTWHAHDEATRSIATNCATRACARGGRLEDGLRLLEEGLRGPGLRIEAGTLDSLAVAAQAAGRGDLFEELLEERDYLL